MPECLTQARQHFQRAVVRRGLAFIHFHFDSRLAPAPARRDVLIGRAHGEPYRPKPLCQRLGQAGQRLSDCFLCLAHFYWDSRFHCASRPVLEPPDLGKAKRPKHLPKITQAFRTGDGVGWHEHDANLFFGTERFFRPNYAANLVHSWIPALEGVEGKLKAGAVVADVGCGHGASTILMAKAYPKSRFYGFDYHSGSIEYARHVSGRDGLLDQITFEVASAKSYPANGGYDLVAFFDCLHDMGDPVGAAGHVLSTLKAD